LGKYFIRIPEDWNKTKREIINPNSTQIGIKLRENILFQFVKIGVKSCSPYLPSNGGTLFPAIAKLGQKYYEYKIILP